MPSTFTGWEQVGVPKIIFAKAVAHSFAGVVATAIVYVKKSAAPGTFSCSPGIDDVIVHTADLTVLQGKHWAKGKVAHLCSSKGSIKSVIPK